MRVEVECLRILADFLPSPPHVSAKSAKLYGNYLWEFMLSESYTSVSRLINTEPSELFTFTAEWVNCFWECVNCRVSKIIASLGKEFLLEHRDHGIALSIQWFFVESASRMITKYPHPWQGEKTPVTSEFTLRPKTVCLVPPMWEPPQLGTQNSNGTRSNKLIRI